MVGKTYRVSEIAEQNIYHKFLLSFQIFEELVPRYTPPEVEKECAQGRVN